MAQMSKGLPGLREETKRLPGRPMGTTLDSLLIEVDQRICI